MKIILSAYLENDPLIQEFLYQKRVHITPKKYLKTKKKDTAEKEATIRDFALDEDDIESIFDAIEKENPDL